MPSHQRWHFISQPPLPLPALPLLLSGARPSQQQRANPAMANLPAAPITRQIASRDQARLSDQEPGELRDAARRLLVDGDGQRIPFGGLFREHRAIVVFVRDAKVRLIVIGQSSHHHIKPFCSLTGYPHEIYVDPEREIYKILGMKKGEAATTSVQSPHVKSNLLSGSIRSMWRAMTGPTFDFQGDPAQQGGTLILGPGSKVHFVHLDKNRLDHAPISTVLQLAGVKTVNFTNKHQIIDI
ncbi:peroxiredoxin-like 2C isoform X2 [Terrapene carolina triunguis]|uniref:peroxiredoxin-like 2C isoform X2 n=1 Tax=Terrapene triunguis TaxID=2587831 RepID=UPI000CEF73F9|nr:peroxiredoxin-like 2C isoform X2 [Terrapene carolina triunguis]